jgi:hypothetical protein
MPDIIEVIQHFRRVADGAVITQRTALDGVLTRSYAVATVNHQAPDGTIVGREPVEFEVTDPDGAPICDIREAFLELARCATAALEARVAAIKEEQEALRDKVERQRMREKLLAPIQMPVRGKGYDHG